MRLEVRQRQKYARRKLGFLEQQAAVEVVVCIRGVVYLGEGAGPAGPLLVQVPRQNGTWEEDVWVPQSPPGAPRSDSASSCARRDA